MNDERRVVVIGSGPAGAMAARTLIEQGIPVTMLESGTTLPPGMLLRVMGRNIFRRRPPLADGRATFATDDPNVRWYHDFVPGGLSNYWTGIVPRFAPDDFSEGERLHERYRWPVSYEDLAPYYQTCERLLRVVGDRQDVPNLPAGVRAYQRRLPRDWQGIAGHAAAFGQGFTSAPMADGPSWMAARRGVAFNSFSAIVAGLTRSPHFRLVLGAHALRLEWSGSARKVRSVVYCDRTAGCQRSIDAAAVVVAGGPLCSTKLLLDSACSDFPEGLGNTEGVLGRFLHDHAHDMCIIEADRPLSRLIQSAYLTRAGALESEPLLGASCMLGNHTSKRDRLLTFTPIKSRTFGVIMFGTMIPAPCNYVEPHRELKDEFGMPMLNVHLHYGEEVRRTTLDARDRLLTILDAAGYHSRVTWSLPELRPGSSVHYGGTVRMHDSPRYGMLNAWNRLHAVDNVVVADASSFTTGAEKNPTLTVMALAARAAHRLASDLKTA